MLSKVGLLMPDTAVFSGIDGPSGPLSTQAKRQKNCVRLRSRYQALAKDMILESQDVP